MPELPEVEIVIRNLREILQPPFQIRGWRFFRKDLRFKIPQKELLQLTQQKILGLTRRAKYILFELETHFLISHLGMTGSWRVEFVDWVVHKHDHLAFQFNPNEVLVYEDARRFGFIEVCAKADFVERFSSVGIEPLEAQSDFAKLTQKMKKLQAPIKNALMNQNMIVGVGNIYASEILFRAQVLPLKKCSKVTRASYIEIWKWTKIILEQAISKGGSTIENYKNSFGESGNFQNEFQVYGRDGKACFVCGSKIKSKNLAGRNTFWCATCQK
jgi:formamidopyrimidine-DNA glycosylase